MHQLYHRSLWGWGAFRFSRALQQIIVCAAVHAWAPALVFRQGRAAHTTKVKVKVKNRGRWALREHEAREPVFQGAPTCQIDFHISACVLVTRAGAAAVDAVQDEFHQAAACMAVVVGGGCSGAQATQRVGHPAGAPLAQPPAGLCRQQQASPACG